MDFDRLITLIDEFDLSRYQADLLAAVRPAIFLSLSPGESSRSGQSRIGGIPDLPASLAWPKDLRWGQYLCFLLQINLAQLPTGPENPLPSQGMLYLFAHGDPNYPQQLLFYAGPEPLQSVYLPAEAELITDWYDNLIPHRLEFQLMPDIPRWATTDFYALCDRLDIDEVDLEDLGRSLSSGSIGQLFGHVAGIGHDPREDAYVVKQVNPEWLYNYEQRRTLDMTAAQQWQNLLQVNSNRAVDLTFGDAGYLQILIHSHDLQQQNFSQVYVNLESS
ncbi:MAG: DUF1963 domain-containing protein [Aphanocapsa sp. GSE-SYN-MK-11-07L]|jgi:hypothetical protein|nr:DUF1963 domain-containing protein [Aphanocapsa sp. GSE-SYN-MK-11-07L]